MEITPSNVEIEITSSGSADTDRVPPAADAAFDLVLLNPAKVMLFRTGGSSVRATVSDPLIGAERSYLRVSIARAFPLSKPDSYIGLRDGQDKDIGMFVTLDGMDAASRAVVDEELERRYFVPRVQRVVNVKEEFGNVTWEVETDKGRRTFLVQNLRESVQELTPTRVLVTDKDGVRYEFPDVRQLDLKSAAVLQRVM
jgi:hypothetical protein